MKKFSLLVLLVMSFGIVACSSNGATVATYTDGTKTYKVTAGEISKELSRYLPNNPQLASDTTIYKRQILDRHIVPDLMYFEEKSAGLFDQDSFKKDNDNEVQKQVLLTKNKFGIDIVTNNMNKAKFEIVRASHILIKSGTNDNDAKNIAQNILAFLKNSKNLDKDFQKTAQDKSQDPGSGRQGGDLGYFGHGQMVPSFEKAAFGATQKGLVTNLVKSQFGYHIIYVTTPKSKKSLSQIEQTVGKQKFARMQRPLQNKYFDELKKTEVKELFTVTNGLVSVDGKVLAVTNLSDETKLVESFGVTYTWKDVKDVVSLFIPRFIETLNIESFKSQMRNFENFMFLVSAADKAGVENTPKFKKALDKAKKDVYRKLAFMEVKKNIEAKVNQQITDEAIQQQYNLYKTRYVKKEKGKQIQMTFAEAKNRVNDDLVRQLSAKAYEGWKQEMSAKYKVTYNQAGLNALKNTLTGELKKIQKKMKNNSQQHSTRQPRQIKIKPSK